MAWVCVGVMPKNTFRLPELLFALSLYLIGYLKIIFNFVSLVKNNFRVAYPKKRQRKNDFKKPKRLCALPFSIVRRLLRHCFCNGS
ncbi:MAG: hypothetical protein IKZ88_01645 [Neisseriaceae bacterium]|nr:hypothetical protein [Neisseriaceae bacterium]